MGYPVGTAIVGGLMSTAEAIKKGTKGAIGRGLGAVSEGYQFLSEFSESGREHGSGLIRYIDQLISSVVADNWSVLKPFRDDFARAYITAQLVRQNKDLKKEIENKIKSLKIMAELEKNREEMEKILKTKREPRSEDVIHYE